jgi:hypothetical protein
MAIEGGRNICREQLPNAYHDKHTHTLLKEDVAWIYQETDGKIHIALKQDFGHYWLWRKNKKMLSLQFMHEL